jgi:hypothetical protein
VRSRGVTDGPRPARRSKSGAKTERQRGGKGDEGEDSRRPGNRRGNGSRDKGRNWRMDSVDEAKPAPDEAAGQNEAKDAGGKSNKKLQHIEFPELRWRAVTLRNAGVKDSAAACSRPAGKWYANRRRYTERILA